jgi:hypothetical protein
MLIRKVSSHDNEPRKSTLPNWAVIPIILVIIAGFLFMPKMEHIADTNGADNYALATLTEEDILAKTLTCTGGPNYATGRLVLPGGWELSSGVELSAKKFSGITDILWADYILPSDFNLCLEHFSVTEGNFRMMVINEGKIIADVQPGDNIDLLIEDLTGPTYVRIAGESAAFTIAMSEFEYDLFGHE